MNIKTATKTTVQTIDDLSKIIRKKGILQKYNLDKIGVFGSFACGVKFNNIDFCVEKESFTYEEMVALKEDLEKLFHIKVDVLSKDNANPVILYYAEQDMMYVTQ